MRTTFLISLACSMLPLAGCARGNVELLEAQLRNREAELRSLNGQLAQKDQELIGSRREIRLLQQQLADKALTPEATARLAQIEKIEINSQLTGALDQDGQPGDDVLNVVVSPVDGHGTVVKLDGDIEIEALDPALPENERSLGRWQIGIEEAAEKWHEGFIAQGYQLTTPWQRIPHSKEIVLLARYKTPDGREFTATTNIPVDPGAGDIPGLLPLPQVRQETLPVPGIHSRTPDIERVSFEEFVKEREAELRAETASPVKPLSAPVPVITPVNTLPEIAPANPSPVITPADAPLAELKEPVKTAERKLEIPLPEEFPEFAEPETPPFVD